MAVGVERTIHWRGGWARLRPWRGRPEVAEIAIGAAAGPSREVVDECVDRLRASGYHTVVTTALSPAEALGFVDAGFGVRERLHLLSHDLSHDLRDPLVASGVTRRARRGDRPDVLALDQLSFDAFWRLDDRGLEDALHATPSVRFRLVDDGVGIAGYAITGRAARQGYLQRLAIHPRARGLGYARTLIADALAWLRRRGATRALVNTQERNAGALALYEACGFRRLPTSLCVLGREI
ncbi:MAG: GNAT family N-acetyltransferase [Acidimicrobiia bacterium]